MRGYWCDTFRVHLAKHRHSTPEHRRDRSQLARTYPAWQTCLTQKGRFHMGSARPTQPRMVRRAPPATRRSSTSRGTLPALPGNPHLRDFRHQHVRSTVVRPDFRPGDLLSNPPARPYHGHRRTRATWTTKVANGIRDDQGAKSRKGLSVLLWTTSAEPRAASAQSSTQLSLLQRIVLKLSPLISLNL
ncbi:hypothetical protein RvY_16411-3 [Ramazzottius varieornatus]|uniref:Uncharacterized protein n=1 Tax=Ramazzottius varieornatus TaxID=947166 RepID=A0A1D1VYC1_RAMVA|nr:hypothetical protein RvY_16411-3 [Ramazzottius varieornatus]